MFLGKYFSPSMVTKLKNEITNFRQHLDESLLEAWERYKLSIDRCPNHNMLPVTQIDTFYNGLTLRHHDTINVAAGGTFMKRRPEECYDLIENMTAHPLKAEMAKINKNLMSVLQSESSSSITSSSDTEIAALKAEMAKINKNLMSVLQPPLATPKTYMLQEPIKANDAILKNMQPNMTSLTNSNLELKSIFGQFIKMNIASSSGSRTFPVTSPIIEPVASPVSAPRPNQRPLILYRSRLYDQKLRDKANDQREKFFQIFKDLNFNISFADALILMLKFGSSIKSLLTNKDKLFELARTPLNEYCSAVLLKKLPEKLGDPDKFLILCDFLGMAECLTLADLDASINLMPLSVWNKLSLPDFSPTCMTLKLADHLISHPVGVAEYVFVKVGTFHFLTDFVVVYFDADPRVPLILRRYFPKIERALIDVFKANYNDMTANQIDVIDMACEEYSQEVLGFSDVIASGNPTLYYDLIVSTTSPTLTSFGNSDFLLEEVDAFLALEDDPTSPEVDQSYVDTKGDILLLEAFLNDDPLSAPLYQEIIRLKFVELKELPPYLKDVFLEGDDKLPVIIAKNLSVEEKTALITVLKLYKRAIAWKLSDIKGFGNSFKTCLSHLEKMLKRCKDTNLCLNWEKSHFMVKEGIVLGHKISKNEIEADKAKVDVIAKLPHPTTVKGIQSFLGHAGFYRSAVLGQHQEKHFRPIHYGSKTMTEAKSNYITTEKEMLAVVYAFEKFQSYRIMNKNIVYTDHSALKYLFAKKYSKVRLLRWVLLLQEFTLKVIDTKGAENLAADHLSRLENPHQNVLDPKEINELFPLETLNMVSCHSNSSTSWFADSANYHAGNFVVKGMSSQ
nr:reverse transcriptase domain-containing protein [Tanacetum cinerariifolium]